MGVSHEMTAMSMDAYDFARVSEENLITVLESHPEMEFTDVTGRQCVEKLLCCSLDKIWHVVWFALDPSLKERTLFGKPTKAYRALFGEQMMPQEFEIGYQPPVVAQGRSLATSLAFLESFDAKKIERRLDLTKLASTKNGHDLVYWGKSYAEDFEGPNQKHDMSQDLMTLIEPLKQFYREAIQRNLVVLGMLT